MHILVEERRIWELADTDLVLIGDYHFRNGKYNNQLTLT